LLQEGETAGHPVLSRGQIDAAAGSDAAVLPFQEPGLRVAVHAQLGVRALDGEEVHLRLVGQEAAVLPPVIADPLLLLIEDLLGLLELHLEEGGGGGGLTLALLRVRDHVEARERVRHLGRLLRILIAEAHRERHRAGLPERRAPLALLLELDVLAQAVGRGLQAAAPPQLRVQVEGRDELLEPRAAQDLFVDRGEPHLELVGDGRLHQRLRHLLPLDEHGGLRLVETRHEGQHAHDADQRPGKREDGDPLSPRPDGAGQIEHRLTANLVFHAGLPG
jgi:hypothetical protein